jgi:epoxyqueuosine reductase
MRAAQAARQACAKAVKRLAVRTVVTPRRWLWRFVPSLPDRAHWLSAPVRGPWQQKACEVPPELRAYAGARTEPELQEAALNERPLKDFWHQYPAASTAMYQTLWRTQVVWLARLERNIAKARGISTRRPAERVRPAPSPEVLTSMVKAVGLKAGLSAIGITEYDPKYRFSDYAERDEEATHARVVVCVLEENYAGMQSTPSIRHDNSTLHCISDLMKMQRKIGRVLNQSGYRCHIHDYEGGAVTVPYAVQAGLGQLGLNGVLLTPAAGPRVRLAIISTDAPLVIDRPVDYGIPRICDNCRVCVRNCPARALSARRRSFRGVEKAKVNAQRCLPVVASAHGCGICLKVCPIQRYGLKAVHEEFVRTGKVLGKDSDELEGYSWEGQYYGPAKRPILPREFFRQPAYAAVEPPHPDDTPTDGRAERNSTL